MERPSVLHVVRGTTHAFLVHEVRAMFCRRTRLDPSAVRRLVAFTFVVAVGQQVGCGIFGGGGSDAKQTMLTSADNPAGQGTVQARAGDNGNTDLDVRVKHLAPPGKAAADASVYVVWIKPRNAELQNMGALELDDDLVGRLRATTPHRSFTVTVTPEPSSRMAAPTHPAVFTAEVNRTD
jgi:hypothetical protein